MSEDVVCSSIVSVEEVSCLGGGELTMIPDD
jgi:hypothetical protein